MYTEPQIFANLVALQGHEKNHNQDGKNQFPGYEGHVIHAIFPYTKLKHLDWITDDFVGRYAITEDTIIGAESVVANTYLKPHVDRIRRSNLLINVGNNVAYVEHTIDGVMVEVTIQPGESLLINTKLLHGSNNKTDEDFKLLTINTRQAYQRRLDEQV